MNGGCVQIPESFIRKVEADRRELVEALEKNDTGFDWLVADLYPDTAHLVFELLQNAEDAGATSAWFKLDKTKLSFTHDGQPFSTEDLRCITNYGRSAKYEQKDKIGRFGIGFKSVFACTETPKIYSDTVAFEIVDRIVPRAIPRPASSVRLSKWETVIELPFNGTMKTGDAVRGEIRLALAGVSVMSVLHLENIESIEWRTDDGDSGWIKRTELADGVVQVDAMRPSGEERRCFLRFREPYAEGTSMHLDVVFDLQKKNPEQETLEEFGKALADRFRIVPAETGRVAVFFPARKETSNLRFHLHAPFIPELSRASIKEHPDNDALIDRLAELVGQSLPTIRDMGLLDREFLGVLPNSYSPVAKPYQPFHKAIVQAMRDQPLVPMQGGGHGRATRLLQGRAEFKEFLGVDDICFLMSGWDSEAPQYYWQSPVQKTRSSVPSSNYRGWAVSATQRNSAVDRLLRDLAIREFKGEHLAPPTSKTAEEIKEWLATHDVPWHRAYYASLERVEEASPGAYERLQRLPIVRTRSGEYRPAAACHFANDADDAPEGVTIADPDIYSSGKGAKRAKAGLERLGVQKIDDESRAVGILDAYYGDSGRRPPWDVHKNHIESFIEFVGSRRVTKEVFSEYWLLLDRDEVWVQPDELYAGSEYLDATGAAYYRLRHDLQESASPCQIHSRYRGIPGFDEFAKRIGVAYRVPVLQTETNSNPESQHLGSGGGKRWTSFGIDRDWHIPYLDRLLERLEQVGDCEAERESLARAVHMALSKTREHAWPPPGDCEPEDASGCLVAVFRWNRSYRCRTAPSQLVFTLRKYAWVPQEQREDGLFFVKPRFARADQLPDWFAFASGWAWIKAIEFGEEGREAERNKAQERLDQEAKAKERDAMAKALGFEDSKAVESGRWFADLSEREQETIKEGHAKRNRPPPDFPAPRNPERRRARAKEEARKAPKRETEIRTRSVPAGGDVLREQARTVLLARYEECADLSLCQVSGCEERSFKLAGGDWYFDAVRFLGLERMIAADHLALCPVHAAMFRHANDSRNGLKRVFAERRVSGNGGNAVTVPIVLAGEELKVLLAPEHVIDLDAALEASEQRDWEGE